MRKSLLALFVPLAIMGCDDSGSSEDSGSAANINALIQQTNTPSYVHLIDADTGLGFTPNGIVRFDVTSQIPLYYVSSDGSGPSQEIVNGISSIESRLGDIFTDFTPVTADLSGYRDPSYPSENRGNGTFDKEKFNSYYGITYGIVFSSGTAYYSSQYSDSPQNMCANASSAPYDGGLSINIDPNTHLYSSDTVVWVNMGNGQCSWDHEMVTHETAHNMGMFTHVEPHFGLWSATAMNMLATMYSNPAGTGFSDLIVNTQ